MDKGPYIPESEIIEKFQSGDYNWVDYISHYSKEWCDEYEQYCAEHNLNEEDNDAAAAFVDLKNKELEEAIANGNA